MADRRVVGLVDGFAASRARLEARVEAMVVAELSRFGGWYSPRQVQSLTESIAATLSTGQVHVARLTDAYLAQVTSYVTNRAVVGATVPTVMGRTLRNGVTDHQQVYARVAAEYRLQRSRGLGERDALGAAMTRAREMVSTDLGLAHQHQVRRFTDKNRISRFRRVVRPELSASGSCGLCVAASDRLYTRGDLLPVHARCKCTVIPVTANTDLGSQLNEDTLAEAYEAAGSTSAADLKRTRFVVVDHGELGPQLRLARHAFRGPGEVAAA